MGNSKPLTTRLRWFKDKNEYPQWWINFEESLPEVPADHYTSWFMHRRAKLKEFNAVIAGTALDFETEEDLTLFLLRWS